MHASSGNALQASRFKKRMTNTSENKKSSRPEFRVCLLIITLIYLPFRHYRAQGGKATYSRLSPFTH